MPPAWALRGIRGARGIPAKLVVAGRRRTGSARLTRRTPGCSTWSVRHGDASGQCRLRSRVTHHAAEVKARPWRPLPVWQHTGIATVPGMGRDPPKIDGRGSTPLGGTTRTGEHCITYLGSGAMSWGSAFASPLQRGYLGVAQEQSACLGSKRPVVRFHSPRPGALSIAPQAISLRSCASA